ncbi:MAG: prepilin-type N-terminal cleavage/methylation domain-containing protein [Planctomycetaceae bacterium]|nr:prepilin-type N-terminal cleavage/methylation domain-containing protein [Planctomycetaceae bacterium]
MRTPRTQRRLRGSGVRSSLLAYRSGFTLIELLVAITIFIILTTLTVATINLNLGNERITAASRQVQAMLEGARSRAFKLQRPVGVRFILDQNFPGEVTGMVYVGAIENPGGSNYQTGKLRFVDLDLDGDTVVGVPALTPAIQQLPAPGSITWSELNTLQLLRSGVRIRIPASTGTWYTVSSDNFLTPDSTVLRLTSQPLDVASYGLRTDNYSNPRGTVYNYELDLSTVMAPLPGEDPVQLPPGTVIDLRSSKVPSNWNINRWRSGVTYSGGSWVAGITSNGLKAYLTNNGGVSGGSEPNWNSANTNGASLNDNGVIWQCYQVPLLDVVFTPQGTLMGAVSAEGLLHFTLAETRDTREPFDDGTVGLAAWDVRDTNGDGRKPDHKGSFRVVTVFAASGAVNVSPVDQTDANDDGVTDDLFLYAIEGATAK